ncbi:hypothetical protein STENM327S_07275 [Streptomyces tendae]
MVSAPNPRGFALGGGAVVIDIELPTGSRVRGDALAADFVCVGRLGECRLSTDCGHIEVDQAGPLHLTSSILGNVTVAHAHGDVEALAEGGDVHIRVAEAGVQLNRTKGNSEIGEVSGRRTRVRGQRRPPHRAGARRGGGAGLAGRHPHRRDHARAARAGDRVRQAGGRRRPGRADPARPRLARRHRLPLPGPALVPGACADRSDAVHIHAHTIIGDIVVRRTSYDLDDGSWP